MIASWQQFADLTHINRRMAESQAQMARLRDNLERMKSQGDEMTMLEELMRVLGQTLAQLEEHRSKLMADMDSQGR